MTTETRNLDWWVDHTDAERKGEGYIALCPAHDDIKPSLSITEMPDGSTRVKCFAGCTFASIFEALDGKHDENSNFTITKRQKNPAKTIQTPKEGAAAWWMQYTGVPIEEWESWGTRFTTKEIIFGWKDLLTEKRRKAGTKEFFWTPEGCTRPPLWPQIPAELPERVYISEGESDLGVLRHLGFDAYALMKGVQGVSKTSPVWLALHTRGCREIVFVLDLDDAANKQIDGYVEAARAAGLQTFVLHLNGIVDTLLGEKDIRDVWIRTHDIRLKDLFLANVSPIGSSTTEWTDIMSFMQTNNDEIQWIVKDILLQQTVCMIVGAPKLGKTWLAHDLMLSVATGEPFLGQFEVQMQGPVVYISKEDPNHLLHDRFAKVLEAKGLGGFVSHRGKKIVFPLGNHLPVFLDLGRDFMFTNEGDMKDLMERLRSIKAQYGYIALIIFDPVLRMIGGDIDVNSATDVNKAIFQPAEAIRKEMGASVLLVHHRSKGGGSEGKGSYGSIGFHAFSEGTQYLLGDEPDKDGWVHVRGEFKSAAETNWSYRFSDLTSSFTTEVYIGSKAPTRKTAVRDLILLELKKSPRTLSELAQVIDVTESTVRGVMQGLEQNGEVERETDLASKRGGGRPREFYMLAAPR